MKSVTTTCTCHSSRRAGSTAGSQSRGRGRTSGTASPWPRWWTCWAAPPTAAAAPPPSPSCPPSWSAGHPVTGFCWSSASATCWRGRASGYLHFSVTAVSSVWRLYPQMQSPAHAAVKLFITCSDLMTVAVFLFVQWITDCSGREVASVATCQMSQQWSRLGPLPVWRAPLLCWLGPTLWQHRLMTWDVVVVYFKKVKYLII